MDKVKSYEDVAVRDSGHLGIVVHPCEHAGAIIINCPGFRGHINGYNNKYVTLADFLVRQNVGAVVRMPNIERPQAEYKHELLDDLRAVMDYALLFAEEITGVPDPEIYLMGFSAGGYAVASVAAEYPQVTKILLMAPSGPHGDSLSKFSGDVYIAIGNNDTVVGSDSGGKYYELATGARTRQLVFINNCDHQFTGRVNGQIMSKAPLWAFAGDRTFPSPDGGIVLY